jgi:hypothetical protein
MAAIHSSRERLRIFGSGVIRWTLLLSWLLLVFTPSGNAAERDGEKGGKPHGGAPFAIADFDGDNRLDLASVQAVGTVSSETQYLINFQLSSGRRQSVDVLAPAGGLRLTPRDVNGDEFPDVVVTTAWAERPVAVFLNDGLGNFTRSEPSAFPDAFEVPGSSLRQAADPNRDTAVAVSPRPPTGECDEYHPQHSPHPVIEYLATKYVPLSDRKDLDPFFGRAPPFLT